MLTKVTDTELKAFFFQAMRVGYANQGGRAISGMLGHKSIQYDNGDLHLIDQWCSGNVSNNSSGMTTIWFKDRPIWVMHYWGNYADSATSFLKDALMQCYKHDLFYGGRGPLVCPGPDGLLYRNQYTSNRFERFAGREEIVSLPGATVLGWHEYAGMSLA